MGKAQSPVTASEWKRLRTLLWVLLTVVLAYALAAPWIARLQEENRRNARHLAALQDAEAEAQQAERMRSEREQTLRELVERSAAGPREYCELSALVATRDQPEAIRVLEGGAKRFPKSISVHATLATLYQEVGRVEEALGSLEGAHRLAPENPLVIAALVDFYVGLGWAGEAAELLKHARPADQSNPSIRLARASLAVQTGDFRSAKELLEPLPEGPNTPVEVLVLRAQVLQAEGDLQVAVSLLEKALARDPAQPLVRVQLTEALLELGGPKHLRMVVEVAEDGLRYGNHPGLKRALGLALARQGNASGAVSHLLPLVEEGTADAPLLTTAASSLQRLGRADEARRLEASAAAARAAGDRLSRLRSRANLAGASADEIIDLAEEYHRQGSHVYARIELRRALARVPGHPRARALLARPSTSANPAR